MDTTFPREEKHPIIESSLSFFNASGHSTPAIFAQPSIPTHLGVILCHGFLSDKQSRTNRRLTELLVPQGIATFRFDWYGMGETYDHFPHLTLKQCMEQLDAAFQLLQERGVTTLGLIGSSFGGYLAIFSASNRHSLQALGLKCPVVDFPEVLRLEFGQDTMKQWKSTNHIPNIIDDGAPIPLHYRFYEECLTYKADSALSQIQTPTLVVHGDQDELIPWSQIDHLMKKLTSPKELKLIKGADHQFGRPEEFRQMTTHLAQWMITHLAHQ